LLFIVKERLMASRKGLAVGLGVAAGGALILVMAFAARSSKPPPGPPPKKILNLARIRDEGSLTRQSPEEEFLSIVSKTPPTTAMAVDPRDPGKESRRVLGGLRDLFAKMKGLAEAYKKTDPARYAAEMEALKEELASLMQAAKILFKESDAAVQELFRMIREEADPVVKDRMAFLLRFVNPAQAVPYAVELSGSGVSADRRAAIGYLQEVRTKEASDALLRRADADPETELRQRSIVGLGKQISGMSPEASQYRDANLDALRKYVQPSNEAPIRAAAWDAFSYPPLLAESDKKLIRESHRTEKDRTVLKSIENAQRHLNVREKAEADRLNPKTPVAPR
jgi:hypothetical protein